MNNKERFLNAMGRMQPDRIPFFELEFNEESIVNIGKHFTSDVPQKKMMVDYTPKEVQKLYETMGYFIKELDIDALSYLFGSAQTRIAGSKDLIQDVNGCVYKLSEHGDPFPIDGPVKDPSDLKKLKLTHHPNNFELLKFMRALMPERALVFCVAGQFKMGWGLMGKMENLLLNYVTNQEFCLNLSRKTTDYIKEAVEIAIDNGADVILLDGDITFKAGPLMSPDQYRKFLKPYHKEVIDLAHNRGVPIFKHSDGNLWPLLDDLLEIGIDGFHPIEPQCMDIKQVKDYLKGRACILGNIDCMDLLPFGTEEEVIETVKDTIVKAAPGGGYILSSSNSIHPGCKAENVIAMFRAAKKYGTYPINIE